MATAVAANNIERLQMAEAVAREKMIDRSVVIEAMEEAYQKAARSRYGAEYDIRASIDPKSGELTMTRVREVVEEIENTSTEMLLEDAKAIDGDVEIGGFIVDPLPPMEFGRVAAQTAKQVIVQKVREAERDQQFEEYKDRVGEIINGTVKRVEYGNVVVDLGRGEAVVRRDQQIPREMFRQGDRIRALVLDVRREARGPQIFLSRAAPPFMAALFMQEVPEIYDGIIEIKAVARDPGSRAKIGVISNDSSIDPVGACVGMRGSRVQAVVGELQGEKIDIIPWSDDEATFIVNALQPAEVAKVVLDEEAERIEVVVPDDQLSLAIGRRGQNVRLASQLTGWDIDIMTEADESERRQKEFETQTAMFIEALDVDEMIANLLVSEGFSDLEDVAFVPFEEIASIDGFDDDTASELQTRAVEYLEAQNAAHLEAARAAGMQEDLIEFDGLSPPMLAALAAEGILTLQDFAELADWELAGGYTVVNGQRTKDDGILENHDVGEDEAQTLIMTARVVLGMMTAEEAFPVAEEVEEEIEEEEGDEPASELSDAEAVFADFDADGKQAN